MHKSVKFFRSNFVEARFVSLVVSLCVLAMRIGMFLTHRSPISHFADTGFLWQYISPLFANPLVSFVSATTLVFLLAWLMMQINNVFTLIRSRTHLPFVVPLLFFSLHPYFLFLSADLVATAFILLAFFPLLHSYQQPMAQTYSFRAAILLGIASLFQVYVLLLLPLWCRGESSMRGMQFRAFLAFFFGIFIVYVSTFSVFFALDNLQGFIVPFHNIIDISVPQIPVFSVPQWIAVGSGFIFFVLIMFFSIQTYTRDKVLTLTTLQFLVFLLFSLLIFQVLFWSKTVFFLTIGMPLLSFLIAYLYTLTINKIHVYSAYFVLLLAICFYAINYFSLIG